MVFPSEENSPFSGEGSFKELMIEYIRENFADLLGDDVALLDHPYGLDLIQSKYPIRTSTRDTVEAAARRTETDAPVVKAAPEVALV